MFVVMEEEKKYKFHRLRPGGRVERIEKTEDELTSDDQDLLLGEMVQIWNNNTKLNQKRFMGILTDGLNDNWDANLAARLEDLFINDDGDNAQLPE